MKFIWSLSLVFCSVVSFGQASYFDKGTGSDAGIKLGSSTMDMIAENNVDGIWENWAPRAVKDTAGIKEMGKLISEEFQAGEGHDAVIDVRENVPASYERTFYQTKESGVIQYLYQVKINMNLVNGKPMITAIHALKGPAVHRYDRILKADATDTEEKPEKAEKEEKPDKKDPPVRHKKGDDDEEED